MARLQGPTVARWRLGEELARLRHLANVSTEEVADHLGCSASKIRRVEAANSGQLSKAELTLMLQMFEVPEEDRPPLFELWSVGKTRGWWAPYGRLPDRFTEFLSLESSAVRIRSYEPLLIHGLLQTEDYARAVEERLAGAIEPEEVDRQVGLRLDRQKQVLGQEGPALWVLLDEAAIKKQVGGPEVMAAQLEHLLEIAHGRHTVQVVPVASGAYPGMLGTLTLFEFPDNLHSPVAFAMSHAGPAYMEDTENVSRCSLLLEHISAEALDRGASRRLIQTAIRELKGS